MKTLSNQGNNMKYVYIKNYFPLHNKCVSNIRPNGIKYNPCGLYKKSCTGTATLKSGAISNNKRVTGENMT